MKKSWRPLDELPDRYLRVMLWFEPQIRQGSRIEGHMLIAYKQADGWSMDKRGKHVLDKVPSHWRHLPSPPGERLRMGDVLLQRRMDEPFSV